MQHISITADGTNVQITVDGIRLTDLHSFSLDYVKGSPLLFSCVADVWKAADKPRGILQ